MNKRDSTLILSYLIICVCFLSACSQESRAQSKFEKVVKQSKSRAVEGCSKLPEPFTCEVLSVAYDIQKTDSITSPFTGVVEIQKRDLQPNGLFVLGIDTRTETLYFNYTDGEWKKSY